MFILLDTHPNIEMRLFNPIARKGVYAFNCVGNFKLPNRRMHNKSRTIDNQVVETKEPNSSGSMRFKAWFLKIVPEKQL